MITTSPLPVFLAATSLLHALTHSHQLSHALYIASILLNTVRMLVVFWGGVKEQVADFDTLHIYFCLILVSFIHLILKASFKMFITVQLIKY